jgi:hypothetical protein
MYTYFLERNDRKSVWELCSRPRGERIVQLKIKKIISAGDQTIDGYMELHDFGIYQEDGTTAEQINGYIAHNPKKPTVHSTIAFKSSIFPGKWHWSRSPN